jgi:hypothetical protein
MRATLFAMAGKAAACNHGVTVSLLNGREVGVELRARRKWRVFVLIPDQFAET